MNQVQTDAEIFALPEGEFFHGCLQTVLPSQASPYPQQFLLGCVALIRGATDIIRPDVVLTSQAQICALAEYALYPQSSNCWFRDN